MFHQDRGCPFGDACDVDVPGCADRGLRDGAFGRCDKWRPDVLISDIGFPGEDGYTLMKKLRARESERGGYIPAIALRAYGRQEDRLRAHFVGYQHYPKAC